MDLVGGKLFKIKKFQHWFLIGNLMIFGLLSSEFLGPIRAQAHNNNNLISDGEFIDSRTLDADGVQSFLNTKGGTRLRTFREGGRTAAQIIAGAARAYGVNPFVVLATIQKEESLIESNTNFDYRVRWAMGYGVCDGCDSNDPALQKYAGFTKQVYDGTWQLKRNYSYWASGGDWRVGNTMIIDGTSVHFDNRATSALYRYTPHLHGNENFVRFYDQYKTYRPPATYDARLITQIPRANYTVRPGQRFLMQVVVRNTGTAVWNKNGANPMHLGNWGPQDRTSSLIPGNIRWDMVQSSVRRNGAATFRIWVTAPQQEGTYVEKFRPVMEYVTWLGPEITYTINVGGNPVVNKKTTKGAGVTTNTSPENYSAQFVTQVGRSSMIQGQKQTIYAYYKNTGTTTWYKNGANPVYLGDSSPQDRSSVFTGGNIRWQLVQSAVAPGRVGVFKIIITAPNQSGTYTERFRPVVEYKTWMGEEVTFNFTVR